ncbi:MAG: hypothetical protein MJ107_01570 [Lachnospiraceae bacterium]|nr:hypothetical protein [Lachnospiraceae bacterium]
MNTNNTKQSREDQTLASIFEAIDLEAASVSPAQKRKQKFIKFISGKFFNVFVWVILALVMAVLLSHLFVLLTGR